MRRKKFFNIKNVIAVLVIAVIVVSFYRYADKKSSVSDSSQTEYDILVEKDLEYAYPETPSEVVKLFSRMVKCMYNGNLPDDMLETIIKKQRLLFYKTLTDKNSLDDQLSRLKEEIEAYEKADKCIISYTVDGNKDVSYSEQSGLEYANLSVVFTLRGESKYEKSYEKFTLCKDDKGWKIVGWELDDSKSSN